MIYRNPAVLQGKPVAPFAGGTTCSREKFDFADTAYRPASLPLNDLVQIGVVPAGQKLLPHLCCLQLPIIDTNGTATGQVQIGTAGNPTALKAAGAVNTAQVLSGEDFTVGTGAIGAKDVDVPIYLKVTTAVATVAATGAILFDVVTRPYDGAVDTDVT